MQLEKYKNIITICFFGLFGFSITTVLSHTVGSDYKVYVDSSIFVFYVIFVT
jgi:hypothetical protein